MATQVPTFPHIPSDDEIRQFAELLGEEGTTGDPNLDEAISHQFDIWEWANENIDTTPRPTGKFAIDQPAARQVVGAMSVGRPVSTAGMQRALDQREGAGDFDPTSPEGLMRQSSQSGVDRTTGPGFGTALALALKADTPAVRENEIRKMVDRLGYNPATDLPAGVQPFGQDPLTGELLFLRKDPDSGKFVWTSTETGGLSPEDIANLADPGDLLGMVGAIGGAFTSPATPNLGATFGGIAGRTAGEGIELGITALTDPGLVSSDEAARILQQGVLNEAIAGAAGKLVDLAAQPIRRLFRNPITNLNQESFNNTAEEIADAVDVTAEQADFIRELTGENLALTPGQVADDPGRGVVEATNFRRGLSQEKQRILNIEARNTGILARATSKLNADDRFVADVDPAEAAQRANEAVRSFNKQELKEFGENFGSVRTRTDNDGSFVAEMVDGQGTPQMRAVAWPSADGRTARLNLIEQEPGSIFENQGVGEILMRDAAEELITNQGRQVVSDTSVTLPAARMAQRLKDQGWDIQVDPRFADANGNLDLERAFPNGARNLDSDAPLFTIRGMPQDVGDEAFANRSALLREYNPALNVADSVQEATDAVSYLRGEADSAVSQAMNRVNYDPKTGRSDFNISLNRGNTQDLNRSINRLRQGIERGFVQGADSPRAQQLLANLQVPPGGAQVDVVAMQQLRDGLEELGQSSGSAAYTDVAQNIDALIQNSRNWVRRSNGRPAPRIANQWKGMDREAREMASRAQEAGARFKGNQLFEEGGASTETVDRLTNGGVHNDMLRLLETNPGAQENVRNELMRIYQDRVLAGNQFNRNAHNKFMRDKGPALRSLFGEDEYLRFQGQPGAFQRAVSQADENMEALKREHMRLFAKQQPQGMSWRKNLIDTWRGDNVPFRKVQRYMDVLRKANPEAAEDLLAAGKERINDELSNKFFSSVDAGEALSPAKANANRIRRFGQWVDDNSNWLEGLYGRQYVRDLRTVKELYRKMNLRTAVTTTPPEVQPTALRMSRSVLGPLHQSQRVLSALNMRAQHQIAENTFRIMSDPAQMRMMAVANNLDLRTTAGSQVAARLGLFEGTHIDPMSEDYVEVLTDFYNEMRESEFDVFDR